MSTNSKRGRLVTYFEGLFPIKSMGKSMILQLCGLVRLRDKVKIYIYCCKAHTHQNGQGDDLLWKAYYDKLWQDFIYIVLLTFIEWLWQITRQIKNILSLLTECLCPPKLSGYCFNLVHSLAYRYATLQSYILARSRGRLKYYISTTTKPMTVWWCAIMSSNL